MNKEEALKKIEELKEFVANYEAEESFEFNVKDGNTEINGESVCRLYSALYLNSDVKGDRPLEIAILKPLDGYEFKITEGAAQGQVLAMVKKDKPVFKVGDKVRVDVSELTDSDGIKHWYRKQKEKKFVILDKSNLPGYDWQLSNYGHISESHLTKVEEDGCNE